MYRSKFQLDQENRNGRRIWADPNEMHRAILMDIFRSDASSNHVLWRQVRDTLYVQSDIPPQGVPDGLHLRQTKELGKFCGNLSEGTVLRYNLRAMPTRSIRAPKQGVRGRREFIHDERERISWMMRKGTLAGCRILSCSENEPTRSVLDRRLEKGGRFPMKTVCFRGKLQITDADAFRTALHQGIGRGKAFGCGLLFVVPC